MTYRSFLISGTPLRQSIESPYEMTLLGKSTTCKNKLVSSFIRILSINLTSIAQWWPRCTGSIHFVKLKSLSCSENGITWVDNINCQDLYSEIYMFEEVLHSTLHPTFEELFWEEAGQGIHCGGLSNMLRWLASHFILKSFNYTLVFIDIACLAISAEYRLTTYRSFILK